MFSDILQGNGVSCLENRPVAPSRWKQCTQSLALCKKWRQRFLKGRAVERVERSIKKGESAPLAFVGRPYKPWIRFIIRDAREGLENEYITVGYLPPSGYGGV